MDLKDKIESKRHEEVVSAMGKVVSAVSSIKLEPNEDKELKKLLFDNKEAISIFVKSVENLSNSNKLPEKLEVNQDKVVSELTKLSSRIGEIFNGIDARISALENKPIPTKLKAVRNNYSGEIDYITIEYLNKK